MLADADEHEARPAKALAELGTLREAAGEREAKTNDTAKLRRELVAANEALAEAVRERDDIDRQARALTERLRDVEEDIEVEREAISEQIAELRRARPRELFCARCARWAPEGEWAWQGHEEGGEYAYHRACGDHGPGLLGIASWLARRG